MGRRTSNKNDGDHIEMSFHQTLGLSSLFTQDFCLYTIGELQKLNKQLTWLLGCAAVIILWQTWIIYKDKKNEASKKKI